jgi:hypothetical protein
MLTDALSLPVRFIVTGDQAADSHPMEMLAFAAEPLWLCRYINKA